MADGAHDLAAATSMGSMADGAAVTSVAAPVISTTMTVVLGDLKRRRQELKASLKDVSKTLKSESKKQKRLIAKAGRLSKEDLFFCFHAKLRRVCSLFNLGYIVVSSLGRQLVRTAGEQQSFGFLHLSAG